VRIAPLGTPRSANTLQVTGPPHRGACWAECVQSAPVGTPRTACRLRGSGRRRSAGARLLLAGENTFEDGLGIIHYCRLGDLLHSLTVYNTKGTRAHTHRELDQEWLREPKGSSLDYLGAWRVGSRRRDPMVALNVGPPPPMCRWGRRPHRGATACRLLERDDRGNQATQPYHWRTRKQCSSTTNFSVGLFSSMPLCECEMC